MLDQDGGRGSPPQDRGDAPEAEMVDATHVPTQDQIQLPGWVPDTYSSYLSYNPYGSYFENFEGLGFNDLDNFAFGQPDHPPTSLDIPDDNDAGFGDLFQDLPQHSTYTEQFSVETIQSGTLGVSQNSPQSYTFASFSPLTNDAPWFSTTPRTQESGGETESVVLDKQYTSDPHRESTQPGASVSNTSSSQPADSNPRDDQDVQAAASLLSFGQINVRFDADFDAAEMLQKMSSSKETIIESIEKDEESIALRIKKRSRRAPSAKKKEAFQALEPARKKAKKTCQKKGKGTHKGKESKKASSRKVHQKKPKKKEKTKKTKKNKMPARHENRAPMVQVSQTATSKDEEWSTGTIYSVVPPSTTLAQNVLRTNRTRLPSAPRPGAPSRHTIVAPTLPSPALANTHTPVAPTLPSPALANSHTPVALPLRLRASAGQSPTHITSTCDLEDPFSDQNNTQFSATTSVPLIRSPNDFIFSTVHSIYRAPPELPSTLSRETGPETAEVAEKHHDISPSQARKLRNDLARTRVG
ncbi:hypothetical protein F503_06168 [Ophiostoma piceae UAMH 11346]|uniref:Uncharacterized protein n=1 Tax=Ophiostoma piceae (strain UAMH 11346) TaxID=1262450 RepID=S3BTN6_OPHP1|nr:hypothetical protein F503_06168 [Ophiostoma piceae UAMH 11346]